MSKIEDKNKVLDPELTESESNQEKKKRGRKPIPKENRRIGRYLKCPNCENCIYYDYRDKSFSTTKDDKKKVDKK
jgi:hypothetical protein